jgi:small nuclear ribonucleoprotein (snRNP)-like protein
MQTILQGTTNQIELIKRLSNYHGKPVKIKLCDGTSIEGRFGGFPQVINSQKLENGKTVSDLNTLPNVCYLKEEFGTITIPFGQIADVEAMA